MTELYRLNNRSMIIDRRISKIDSSRTYTISSEGKISEAIYFVSNSRRIIGLCISSQFGCQMKCQFCANQNSDFEGNIPFDTLKDIIEMIEMDVLDEGLPMPNTYDLKGIGEPLLNFNTVLEIYHYLKNKNPNVTLNLSTCGIINNIYKLADTPDCDINLFWSMHSPFQKERQVIMPSAKNYSIDDIICACIYYSKKKNTKVTASYLLLGNNGSKKHLERVVELLPKEHFNIEVLLYNKVDGNAFVRPTDEEAYAARDYFRNKGFTSNVIISKGRDTGGGCGQLRNKYIR